MEKKKPFPKIALGAWAWGNDGTFGQSHSAEDMKAVFEAAMKKGLNLWDTAYVYGMGASEKTLGSFLKGLPRDCYMISDKFTPQCADKNDPDPIGHMLEKQYNLLGIHEMDIYWIHNPVDAPHYIKALAKYFEGKKRVPLLGVSNHNMAQIQEAQKILKQHGLKLSAVQNHYSLLHRHSEHSGILDYCKEKGLLFFAYMVLEQGALSGKYNTKHLFPQGSDRAKAYHNILPKLEPLLQQMEEMGKAKGASVAQIATAWAISKKTLPIIGVTNIKHVEDAAKSCQIHLDAAETEALEALANKAEVNTTRYWEKAME